MYSNKKYLNLEKEGFNLWIKLNNPDKSNALNLPMIYELIETLESADVDKEVRSIILTGEGKNFCAGGDLDLMLKKEGMFKGKSNELRENYKRGIQKIPLCIEQLSTPLIAMVNGAAIGAGLDLACMCDLRVATTTSRFGETFSKLGLVPGIGGTFFLQRIVGFAKAMEMTLTAKIYSADEALEMNLVNTIVPIERLKQETLKITEMINQNAPIATSLAKRALIHAHKNDLSSNLEMLSAFQGIAQNTDDHLIGAKAIKEKNKSPSFKHQ